MKLARQRLPTDPLFGMKRLTVEFDGAVYFVPAYAAHRPVAQQIRRRVYESPRLHDFVRHVMASRPGSMVHAGAFFGDMLPSFARATPGRVYAFEPVIENYLFARAAVLENGLDNVSLFHAALGDQPGVVLVETMAGHRHRGGASSVVDDPRQSLQRPQSTPVVTVDQLDIKDLSLIQLDVEGYELPVLQGAARTIREQRPEIVIEDNRANCAEFLKDLGYVEAARVDRDRHYAPDLGLPVTL